MSFLHPAVTAVMSEAAEALAANGKQDLAARLIAAGTCSSIAADATLVRALVATLVKECRSASEIFAAALAVMTPEQKNELARRADAKGLIGSSGGTTRQHERGAVIAQADRFLTVTAPPSTVH